MTPERLELEHRLFEAHFRAKHKDDYEEGQIDILLDKRPFNKYSSPLVHPLWVKWIEVAEQFVIVGYQYRQCFVGDDPGWGLWKTVDPCDFPIYAKRVHLNPLHHQLRPIYSRKETQ